MSEWEWYVARIDRTRVLLALRRKEWEEGREMEGQRGESERVIEEGIRKCVYCMCGDLSTLQATILAGQTVGIGE